MAGSLNPDDTIAEVVDKLQDSETYLRNVVGTMRPCFKVDKDATVRIGVSGSGQRPYHLITFKDGDGKIAYRSCDGAKSDTLWEIHPDAPEWSSRGMTYPQVEQLLAQVVSVKTRKRH